MTSTDQSYPSITFRRFVVERLADAAPRLPRALLAVARALADWRPHAPLRYAGDPPYAIEMTEMALATYLAEVQHAWTQHVPEIFRLTDSPDTPQLALFLRIEATPFGEVESIWFSLPATMSGAAFELERLMSLMATICRDFNAHHGLVEDERLLLLYRAKRAVERARANLPMELQQFVPEPPDIEGVSVELPSLLVPQEFDCRRVPDAVWWINFWDRLQVETVTREKVYAAGWQRVAERSDGSLVLAATAAPTEVTNAIHMTQLRRILERLGLYELQQQYQYKE